MHGGLPTLADDSVQRQPGVFAPASVDGLDPTRGIGSPDQVRKRIDELGQVDHRISPASFAARMEARGQCWNHSPMVSERSHGLHASSLSARSAGKCEEDRLGRLPQSRAMKPVAVKVRNFSRYHLLS
jgi:hypothetical protein